MFGYGENEKYDVGGIEALEAAALNDVRVLGGPRAAVSRLYGLGLSETS